MNAPRKPKIPPEHRKVIENFLLLMRSELADLDSKFFAVFANVQASDLLDSLEAYCIARFDTSARYLRPVTASDRPNALVTYKQLLEQLEEKTLNILRGALSSVPEDIQKDRTSRVALKLRSRTLSYLSEAQLQQHDRVLGATPKNRIVTSSTVRRRRELVRAYCRKQELTLADLARRVGISVTAIRGIIPRIGRASAS